MTAWATSSCASGSESEVWREEAGRRRRRRKVYSKLTQ
jgi:hypothetical protein